MSREGRPRRTQRDRIGRWGCGAIAFVLLCFGGYVAVTSRIARVVLAALVLAIVVTWARHRWKLEHALREFRRVHSAPRKDLLLVYSASPHWQSYIEAVWLARWRDRAVVLNRSDPDWTTRPEAELWRRITGAREHTPAAIVIPARGKARVFRFYKAFRDHKHGKSSRLETLEAELGRVLDASPRGGA